MSEGVMQWDAGWTWYRVVGDLADTEQAPAVVLHGGPGAAHDYVEPMAGLTEATGRPCVLYDQIGCGRSQHMPDAPAEFWSVDLFRRELVALLEHLGIAGRYHVIGQSWGGMLGMEHALTHPGGLQALVVANSLSSMPLWVAEGNRLRTALPDDVQAALTQHEAAGTTDSPEYEAAVMSFYERHLCRVVPFPPELQRTLDQQKEDPTVYETMNGPSEFHVIGSLKDWDITDELGGIQVPVLVISGEYDEATPAVVRPLAEGIPNALGRRRRREDQALHPSSIRQSMLELLSTFLAEHD